MLSETKDATTNETLAGYKWSAAGAKLGATIGNTTPGFEYLGSLIYIHRNDEFTLESSGFGSGRIIVSSSGNGSYSTPYYFITDHLGSTRVVVQMFGDYVAVLNQNDYYPFGLQQYCDYAANLDNLYTFSGKEEQITFGLPYLDFGFRMYDPFIARWTTPDPLAEQYYSFSPYNYVVNNPARLIDPDGRYIEVYYGGNAYQWKQNIDGEWGFYGVTPGDTNGRRYKGDDKFINDLMESLLGIMGGATGWDLVTSLAWNTSNTVAIGYGSESQTRWSEYTTRIHWNNLGTAVPTLFGKNANPMMDLAHELAHVLDHWNGTFDSGEWYTTSYGEKVYKAEIYATHIENMIRGEMGLPLRTHYSEDFIDGIYFNLSPAIITVLGSSLFFDAHGALNPGWVNRYKYGY